MLTFPNQFLKYQKWRNKTVWQLMFTDTQCQKRYKKQTFSHTTYQTNLRKYKELTYSSYQKINHNMKQNITTVGLKTTDYSTIKIDINVRLTSVTAVYMASQKKTYSSNTKKTVKASINPQHE